MSASGSNKDPEEEEEKEPEAPTVFVKPIQLRRGLSRI